MKPLIFLLLGVLFFFKSYFFIDPDFGWHLKMGELILKQGIPKTDPFSYTMPSFPFVDHEWLTNVIFYLLYQNFGITALAFLFTLLLFLIILTIRSQNNSRYFLAPLILSAAVLLPFWGVRPQIITLAFLAVLLKIITDKKLWLKARWFLPLLFLLWANLHGGFAAGLTIFILFLALKSFSQKKLLSSDIAIALLSMIPTLVNPYGYSLWREVAQQLSNWNLRWVIAEWAPLFLPASISLMVSLPLLTLSGLLLFYFWKKLDLTQKALYLFLLLAGLSSQRHLPLWVLSALPISVRSLELFKEKIKSIKFAPERFEKTYAVFLTLSFLFFAAVSVGLIKEALEVRTTYFPQEAVEFLKNQKLDQRIFSVYQWGGYLIWQLPGQKVFVDGRMPSWRRQNPPGNESPAAFDEYNQVLNSDKWMAVLDKYKVGFILWPTEKSQASTSFGEKVKATGWQKIYSDSVATIFKRP